MIRNNGLLTHCGQVTPYGNIDLGQHWFRQWLVAWQHQAITYANSNRHLPGSWAIHIKAIHSIRNAQESNHQNTFEHYTHKIKITSSRGQWVNLQIFNRTFVKEIIIQLTIIKKKKPIYFWQCNGWFFFFFFENRTFSVILTSKWYIYIIANAHIVFAKKYCACGCSRSPWPQVINNH